MFNTAERLISNRNLKPKRKEGFLKVISVFSFLGIMLGVAILIIVMSVMNGFRSDLTEKIIGLNPHLTLETENFQIKEDFKKDLKNRFPKFELKDSFNGEGIIMNKDLIKGVFIKGSELKSLDFIQKKIVSGKIKNFSSGRIIIGNEMAFDLDLKIGDQVNLMSSTFIDTPLGGFPKQENFEIIGIFKSGFLEYDRNVIFLTINDALSIFDKDKDDINLEIYLNDPLKADFYKKEIEKLTQDFLIFSWSDLNKSFFSALKVERNVMFVILTLIIIVAAFNIISGLTILIKNKTREIAILKTLGMSSTSIKKTFFLTGFTIGSFATLCGLFIGILFSIYIEEVRSLISKIFKTEIFPPDVYFLDKMPSEISFSSTLIIFIFSLIITSIASYFPASIISRMETSRGLKYE